MAESKVGPLRPTKDDSSLIYSTFGEKLNVHGAVDSGTLRDII